MSNHQLPQPFNVFERIDKAHARRQGITLTSAEVELLIQLCGDAIHKAEGDVDQWNDLIAEVKEHERHPI